MLTDTALRNLKPKSKFSHRELLPMLPRMTRHFFRLGMACLCIGLPLAALAKPPLTGEALYQKACAACHGVGPVEAPKLGDHAAWAELITEGQAVVTAHGWVGVREMPPRGGVPDLSLEAFGRAVAYMARAAGADWQDPELSASLLQAIRAEETARRQALQAQRDLVALQQDEIDRLVHDITALQDELERLREQPTSSPEYSEASVLAAQGLNAEMIAARCGISLAEAELVLSLARRDTGAA